MKPILYLITTDFPYGQGETSFLLPELPYLKDKFQVTVISNSLCSEQTVQLDKDIRVIHYPRKASVCRKLLDSLCFLFDISAYKEIWDILKRHKKMAAGIFESVLFYEEARRFRRFLKKHDVIDADRPAVVYCYWYDYYCLTFTKYFRGYQNLKIVTRTHRYELYDEERMGERQPFKRQMDERLDGVIFIAEHGRRYYLERYGLSEDPVKYPLFRLGVSPLLKEVPIPEKTEKAPFLLVSCAVVLPRKHVEKIVDALALLQDLSIHWVHFGDGRQFKELKDHAEEKLGGSSRISYELPGYRETPDIMKFYGENYVDAFITTTESEGCPVSVQEAMAYGIPVIGTAVAEIPYMIRGNGILLSDDPKPEDVAGAIRELYNAVPEQVRQMRERSLTLWRENFNAGVNALAFAEYLFEFVKENDSCIQ